MLSFDRLSDDNGCNELISLEQEATLEPAMELGIRLHLGWIITLETRLDS